LVRGWGMPAPAVGPLIASRRTRWGRGGGNSRAEPSLLATGTRDRPPLSAGELLWENRGDGFPSASSVWGAGRRSAKPPIRPIGSAFSCRIAAALVGPIRPVCPERPEVPPLVSILPKRRLEIWSHHARLPQLDNCCLPLCLEARPLGRLTEGLQDHPAQDREEHVVAEAGAPSPKAPARAARRAEQALAAHDRSTWKFCLARCTVQANATCTTACKIHSNPRSGLSHHLRRP
jgi:hypothetical protein